MNMLLALALASVPELARALAGDEAGVVARTVTNVAKEVLGTEDGAAARARLDADPALAGLFAERVRAEVAALQAQVADVADARRQTLDLTRAGSRIAWGAPVVSTLVVLGFLGAVGGYFAVPDASDSATANILMGSLAAAFGQVITYWLGSSRGSAQKDEALRALVERLAAARSPAVPGGRR